MMSAISMALSSGWGRLCDSDIYDEPDEAVSKRADSYFSGKQGSAVTEAVAPDC